MGGMRVDGMRHLIASLCVCWLAWCGATGSNTAPLAFGMTPRKLARRSASRWLLAPAGVVSKLYVAADHAGIPGFYPSEFAIALQFRRGRLTGWKKDWRLTP